jgi:hypothetical protein
MATPTPEQNDINFLRAENARLRQQIAELRARPQAAPTPSPAYANPGFYKFKQDKAARTAMEQDPDYESYMRSKSAPMLSRQMADMLRARQGRQPFDPGRAMPSSGPAAT